MIVAVFLVCCIVSCMGHLDDAEHLIHVVSSGSVFKLQNLERKTFLHSHKVNYGSGSGQQSVTGYPSDSDANSYWMVQKVDKTTKQTGVRGESACLLVAFFHAM